MDTVRLTVGQAIVRFMARQYVERDGREQRFIAGVWGIFGHGNVAGFGQALEELGDAEEMPYFRPQNEQAQVHLAAAFARHNNRLRTYACTSSVGPGSMNMITGAAGATVNRIPVLLLPSDYFANRTPDPVLQQIEHPTERDASANDAFRPVSRFFDRISRPEQLLGSLPEAFRILTDPADTGAVTISLPEDVQSEAFDWPERFFDRRVWRVRRPLPEPADVAQAARLIAAATAPLIVVGGGAIYSEATEELSTFATRDEGPMNRDPHARHSETPRQRLCCISGSILPGCSSCRVDVCAAGATRVSHDGTPAASSTPWRVRLRPTGTIRGAVEYT